MCRTCETPFTLPRHIPMPQRISIETGEPALRRQEGYRDPAAAPLPPLVVRWRWFDWHALVPAGFAACWLAVIIIPYARRVPLLEVDLGLLCPLIYLAIGVGMAYYAAVLWVNSSVLRVRGGLLTVRHGPLPWRGNSEVPVSSIHRVTHVRRRHRLSRFGPQVTWEVHAHTDGHGDITLFRGMERQDEAHYVEWVIEEHLGIENGPSRTPA